jgi:sigma-E factor negative regulatory protein RseC
MVSKAKITKVWRNGTAEIEVERKSACGHDCAKCKGCAEVKTAPVRAIARNQIGAKLGELVTVEASSREIMGMAAIVYLLPLLLFFVCYALGVLLASGELAAAVMGGFGFVLGVWIAIWYSKVLKKRGQITFVIVERC